MDLDNTVEREYDQYQVNIPDLGLDNLEEESNLRDSKNLAIENERQKRSLIDFGNKKDLSDTYFTIEDKKQIYKDLLVLKTLLSRLENASKSNDRENFNHIYTRTEDLAFELWSRFKKFSNFVEINIRASSVIFEVLKTKIDIVINTIGNGKIKSVKDAKLISDNLKGLLDELTIIKNNFNSTKLSFDECVNVIGKSKLLKKAELFSVMIRKYL